MTQFSKKEKSITHNHISVTNLLLSVIIKVYFTLSPWITLTIFTITVSLWVPTHGMTMWTHNCVELIFSYPLQHEVEVETNWVMYMRNEGWRVSFPLILKGNFAVGCVSNVLVYPWEGAKQRLWALSCICFSKSTWMLWWLQLLKNTRAQYPLLWCKFDTWTPKLDKLIQSHDDTTEILHSIVW